MYNLNIKIGNHNNILRIIFLGIFSLFIFISAGKASASNLTFSPSTGNFHVGDTFKVDILVDTQGVAINSIETNINFPEEYLDVVYVSKASSIFSLWIAEPSYSNAGGTISFTGGLPTPGYTGVNGKVIEITFKAKVSGVATINYSSSAVRANDGLGTDVLQSTGEGEYTITVKPVEPEVIPVVENKPAPAISPEILSITHPDSNKWYNDKNPKFSWAFPDNFNAIRISYDENPEAVPTIFYSTTTGEKEFDNVRDGIYYLHLEVRDANGWSKISNFKFQIDTERPLNFVITELNKGDTKKTQAEFTFNAADELSGLDHFEINVDDSSPEIINNITNQYYKTGVLSSGKHVIFIKAFDKAGNYVPNSTMFYINSSATSTDIISNIKIYLNETYNGALLVAKDYIKKLGEIVNSHSGTVATEIISILGLIIGALIPIFALSTPFLLSDIFLVISRLLGSMLGIIGFRRKNHAWGTVYDSVTKYPLNLAYVSLIDLETGSEVANSVTDSDGRYGFVVLPGRYGIETRKTNYISPSMNMRGKISDEVHGNLYFGEEIIIMREGERVIRNIPMDSLYFNWGKFIRNKININISINAKNFVWSILNILFVFGAIVSVIAATYDPEPYNILIVGLYMLIVLLDSTAFKKQKNGVLIDENTNIPLSYSILGVYREGEDTPIIKKVADKHGEYYTLVPSGRYHLSVDKKNDDGTYTEILYTKDIDIKDGVINFDIKI